MEMKGPEMKKERKLIRKKTGERRMARKANCDIRVAIHHRGPVPVKMGRTNANIQTARVCMHVPDEASIVALSKARKKRAVTKNMAHTGRSRARRLKRFE